MNELGRNSHKITFEDFSFKSLLSTRFKNRNRDEEQSEKLIFQREKQQILTYLCIKNQY